MYVCKKFKIKGNAMKENNIIKWEKIEKIEENKKRNKKRWNLG